MPPHRISNPPATLFLGMCTIDIQYMVDRLPNPDEKLNASSLNLEVGGPATNAAVTFSELGGHSRLLTQVGSHWLTHALREDLGHHRVELCDINPRDARPPVIACSFTTPCASRSVVSLKTEQGILPPSFPAEALDEVQLLLVDGHHMPLAIEAARLAKTRGITVVFDGGSWKPLTDSLLAHTDIALCSAAFAPPAVADPTPDKVLSYLRTLGVAVGGVTQGDQPLHFYSNAEGATITPPKILAVDTLGAGDVFHGAFCYYFLTSGNCLHSALTKAAQVAAFSCQSQGTRSWFASPAFEAFRRSHQL